jgi:hypothetical protein
VDDGTNSVYASARVSLVPEAYWGVSPKDSLAECGHLTLVWRGFASALGSAYFPGLRR